MSALKVMNPQTGEFSTQYGISVGDTESAYNDGYDAGKEAEWSALWDAIQRGGDVSNDVIALFSGTQWNDDTFKPKYDIVTKGAVHYLFKNCNITDLKGILDSRGLVLDTSAGTNFYETFRGSTITRIPTINALNAGSLGQTFYQCGSLVSIEKLILKSATTYSATFGYCNELADITIEGTIGQNGINVSWSTKLTHDSLMSIINALETKTSGTWTVTLGTTNLAKLSDTEKAIATDKGWTLA